MSLKEEIIGTIKELENDNRVPTGYSIISNGALTTNIEMILVTSNDVAAFCNLDIDAVDWKNMLDQFQSIYFNKFREAWRNKNLELVYFSSKFNSLVSDIEENKYFCRKFVLNRKEIYEEMGRLPFIDLSLVSSKKIKIFKDAQDVLKVYGVGAELANDLSQPGERAASELLKHSLKNEYGEPELITVEEKDLYQTILNKKSVQTRLTSLRIRNFRAYKNEHVFDLDASVVILYGANGLGKTSFFDAVDFAITGGTGTTEVLYPRDIKKQKAPLYHLSASEQECSVEVTINSEEGQNTFLRELQSYKSVKTLEEEIPTDVFIKEFVTKTQLSSEINLKRLRHLFRATYLFGQELPELTQRIKSKSLIDNETLTNLIALQDYEEVYKKASGVLQEIGNDIVKIEEVISRFKEELDELNLNINRLEDETLDKENLNKLCEELKVGLKEILSTEQMSSIEINEKNVPYLESLLNEGLKAAIERASSYSGNKEELSKFGNLQARHLELMEKQKSINEQSIKLNDALKVLDDQINSINKDKKDNLLLIEAKNKSINETEWVLISKRKLVSLRQEESQISQSIKNKEVALESLNGKIVEIEKVHSENSTALSKLLKLKTENEGVVKRTKEVFQSLASFEAKKKDLLNQEGSLIEIRKKSQANKELLTTKQKLYLTESNKIEELNLKKKLEKQESEPLQLVLEQVKTYVLTNICPVCDSEHASSAEILSVIEGKLNSYSNKISDIDKSIIEMTEQLGILKKEIDTLNSKINVLSNEEKTAIQRESSLKIEIEMQIKKAIDLGFLENEMESKVLDNKLVALQAKVVDLDKEILVLQSKGNQSIQSELIDNSKSMRKEIDDFIILKQGIAKSIELLIQEFAIRGQDLKIEESLLIDTIENLKIFTTQKRRDIFNWEGKLSALSSSRNEMFQKCQDCIKEKEIIDGQILKIQTEDARIKSIFRKFDILEKDFLREGFDKIRDKYESKIKKFEQSRNKLAIVKGFYENLKKLKENEILYKKIESESKKLKAQNDLLKEIKRWQGFYSQIQEIADNIRKKSIRDYIGTFGAGASSIQKKLRAIRGFGELHLIPKDDAISIEIENQFFLTEREEMLLPNEYLSSAQMQIISLSIFLSAAISQTWSNFSTILLDDPVQHFDDLNCHNFSDLIRNLIEDKEKKCQFIISTCDELFFNILRSKLPKDKVISYKFDGADEVKGPIFSRIN